MDSPLKDVNQNDTIILVLGQTGVGKSTFINKVVGREVAKVGHDMASQTKSIQHFSIPHPSDKGRLVFVDTPGFDDPDIGDSEILERIIKWLKKSCTQKMRLAIIYLHEITQSREYSQHSGMSPTKLCISGIAEHSILATTKWDLVPPGVGEKRENALSSACARLTMHRFQDTKESAWMIIDHILGAKYVKVSDFGHQLAAILSPKQRAIFFRAFKIFAHLF